MRKHTAYFGIEIIIRKSELNYNDFVAQKSHARNPGFFPPRICCDAEELNRGPGYSHGLGGWFV